MSALGFICTQCSHRQPDKVPCASCGDDSPLDLDKPATIEFLREIEQRDRDRREGRVRMAAVLGGMGVILALWTQGWWWQWRARSFALPFFADQIAYMVLIAFGVIKLADVVLPAKRRFPVLDELP